MLRRGKDACTVARCVPCSGGPQCNVEFVKIAAVFLPLTVLLKDLVQNFSILGAEQVCALMIGKFAWWDIF